MSFGNESLSFGVEQVARALLARGSTREAMAMLRGAVARDRREEGCAQLLASLTAEDGPADEAPAIPLDLTLVDLWIRRGMLVEALALLGGTPLGSDDSGLEWANLLGELLAPVPVDADRAFEETHRQLLSGGASVALTLLEEHARREPKLPAWAFRRLELLRWMLLDNAKAAERRPEPSGDVPSMLAGVLLPLFHRRNIVGALEAAASYAIDNPDDPDAPRTIKALRHLVDAVGQLADEGMDHNRTIPVSGHNAALMQLRMGNLKQAVAVYDKLIKKNPDDERAHVMVEEIEVVQRALRGDPVAPDMFGDATSTADDFKATDRVFPRPKSNPPALGDPFADLEIPETQITQLPERRSLADTTPNGRAYESGPRRAVVRPPPPPEEDTHENVSGEDHAEALVRDGRLQEAEQIYRGLASLNPARPELVHRADELRARRMIASGIGVVVRSIKPIK